MPDSGQSNVAVLGGGDEKSLNDSLVSIPAVVIVEFICGEGGAARLKHLQVVMLPRGIAALEGDLTYSALSMN